MLENWISWVAWHEEWRVRQCPQSRRQTGLSSNNSVPVSSKPESTPFHEHSFIPVSGRAWFHSHLILCMGFFGTGGGLVSSGLGWVFRSCWWVAVSWSHFVQVDTECEQWPPKVVFGVWKGSEVPKSLLDVRIYLLWWLCRALFHRFLGEEKVFM